MVSLVGPRAGTGKRDITQVRILGLDVGSRRIGVAVSDAEERLAFPLTVIQCRGDDRDFQTIADLAWSEAAGAIVVGMPVALNGTFGPQAQQVQDFITRLAGFTDRSIIPWDERYSTSEAERRLATTGTPRRRREHRRARRDALAAAIILQDYLDHLQRLAQASTEGPGPCVSCP